MRRLRNAILAWWCIMRGGMVGYNAHFRYSRPLEIKLPEGKRPGMIVDNQFEEV